MDDSLILSGEQARDAVKREVPLLLDALFHRYFFLTSRPDDLRAYALSACRDWKPPSSGERPCCPEVARGCTATCECTLCFEEDALASEQFVNHAFWLESVSVSPSGYGTDKDTGAPRLVWVGNLSSTDAHPRLVVLGSQGGAFKLS